METLDVALLKEQTRVRELVALYASIPAGAMAAKMMQRSLAKAEQAVMSGDVAGMIAAYKDLKEYTE